MHNLQKPQFVLSTCIFRLFDFRMTCIKWSIFKLIFVLNYVIQWNSNVLCGIFIIFFKFLFLYNIHSFTINFEAMKIYQFDFSLNSSSVRKNLKHNVISHTTFLAFLLFFPFSQGSTFFVSACLLDCLCGTALPSVCAMNARRKYVLNYTWFFWFGRTSMDCIVWQM